MLRLHPHDDVLRLELASRTSRLVGYTVSAFLADDGAGGSVLVDTGLPRAWPSLAGALGLRRGGAVPAVRAWLAARPLRGVVVTHAHEDHAGNVARLAACGLPVAMAAGTRAALRDVGRLPVYRRATWGRMASLATEPPAFDPAPFALVATPGHAPDHHAVWDAARATLYGGDLFLGVRVRIAHAHEDPRLLARSLRAAAALRPARLFDAHRGLVPDPVARLEAKAAWVEDTIARIEALVDRGWTDARVRQAVLGREEWTGVVSRGEYSRGNWVRAVRAGYASMPNSRVASAS